MPLKMLSNIKLRNYKAWLQMLRKHAHSKIKKEYGVFASMDQNSFFGKTCIYKSFLYIMREDPQTRKNEFFFLRKIGVSEKEGVGEKSNNKKTKEGGRAAKKVMPLTQIFQCTFFCNSIFPSWFLTRLDNITASNNETTTKSLSMCLS